MTSRRIFNSLYRFKNGMKLSKKSVNGVTYSSISSQPHERK